MNIYCKKTILKQKELAEALGVHKVYLNAILKGRSKASPLLAKKIEKLTEGAIKASSLRPDIFD